MRTQLSFSLVCAQCGDTLEASDSNDQRKNVKMNSAYECDVSMFIKPCESCIKTAEEPAKLLKEALGLLNAQGK